MPTALRFNEVYVKMYKLMAEFLVSFIRPLSDIFLSKLMCYMLIYYVFQIFKVTPWFAFLILFLSLKDRLSFYNRRKVARTLDVDQGRNQSN